MANTRINVLVPSNLADGFEILMQPFKSSAGHLNESKDCKTEAQVLSSKLKTNMFNQAWLLRVRIAYLTFQKKIKSAELFAVPVDTIP